MNNLDNKAYFKIGFLFFVALLGVFVFFLNGSESEEVEVNESVTDSESEEKDDFEKELDIGSLEENYYLSKELIDHDSEDIKKHIRLEGFDFNSYYADVYGEDKIKQAKKSVKELVTQIISGQKTDVEEIEIKESVREEIKNGDYKRVLKLEKMDLFLIEPINYEEMIFGVNIQYEKKKSEYFEVVIDTNDGLLVVNIVPQWSDV